MKITKGIGKAERFPDGDEIRILIKSSDKKFDLMIEFLVETGCCINEMISAEVDRSRR